MAGPLPQARILVPCGSLLGWDLKGKDGSIVEVHYQSDSWDSVDLLEPVS